MDKQTVLETRFKSKNLDIIYLLCDTCKQIRFFSIVKLLGNKSYLFIY